VVQTGDITITNSPNTTVIIDHSVNTTNNFVIIAPTPTVNSSVAIYRRGEDVLTKNPEIVKMPSAGAMDSTLWLTTHKQFPENDNLVGCTRTEEKFVSK
jgi:hypothetical protein